MLRNKLTLSKKLGLTIIFTVLISILFAYSLSQFSYKRLYVDKVKENLLLQGKELALDYEGGDLTESFKEKIKWYNSKTEAEVFVVNNPRELSACVPFDLDYSTLISDSERQKLLQGKAIDKIGYEKRFKRNIMAVIIPLLDHKRLEGIIYLYLPLASIEELMKEFSLFWLIGSFFFLVIFIFFGSILIRRLIRPIKEMEQAAIKIAEGDFSQRVMSRGNDEIGKLALSFNQMSEAIQQEDERKKEFLANVSHELRTPLSYVKGYTEAILDGIVASKEEERKYLGLILRETGRLQNLVKDLLNLSKLETDSFEINKVPIAMAQFIEDFTQKYTKILKEKNIHLELKLDPEPIIYGDEGGLEQILQNLMDNSVRYTKRDGIISISLIHKKERCILSIADSGTGIPKEDLPNVMNRFYRVNKARTRFDGGTGLGLSIVKKLVEMHQGNIRIKSELNKGTEVIIDFPAVYDENENEIK